MTLPYMGIVGGLVLVVGDDPSLHSSQNEQDSRYFGTMASIPILEPSTGAEAYQMAKYAFDLSEQYRLPVMLRITTRIAHSKSSVTFQELKPTFRTPEFKRNMNYVNIPAIAKKNHYILIEKRKKLEFAANQSPWNNIVGALPAEIGVIVAGVSFTYAKEAIDLLQLKNTAILKIGLSYPIADRVVAHFLQNVHKVIVIEEVEPILEKEVRVIAQAHGILTPIAGKREELTAYVEELSIRKVVEALTKWLGLSGLDAGLDFSTLDQLFSADANLIPQRSPVLCAGCPHRATFLVLNRALGKKKESAIFSNDIGCYALGVTPPAKVADTLLDMGASISMGSGFAHTDIENPIIAIIGDSTFWHSGLAGLVNAIYNNTNMTIVIVDNLTTAMTGMQENPSTGKTALGVTSTQKLVIEKVTEAMGAKTLVIDPWEVDTAVKLVKEHLQLSGVKVIISRRECIVQALRKVELMEPYEIIDELCVGCAACVDLLGCPAISWQEKDYEDGRPRPIIDKGLCTSCSVCSQVCAKDAIFGTQISVFKDE
jgi:indolepyruvate ferredoxin oxidoreductase alpha subunit